MEGSNSFTYADMGFNAFMARSLKSNPAALTLAEQPSVGAINSINFDQMQTSGSIADDIRVGAFLELQGSNGRLVVKDDQSNEVGWAGNLTP